LKASSGRANLVPINDQQNPKIQKHRTPKDQKSKVKSQKIKNWEVLRPRAIQWRFWVHVHVIASYPANAAITPVAESGGQKAPADTPQSDPVVSRMVRTQPHLATYWAPHPGK
jgi:hypothetical protein